MERREFQWLDPAEREWYVPEYLDGGTFWTATMTVGSFDSGTGTETGFDSGWQPYGTLSPDTFTHSTAGNFTVTQIQVSNENDLTFTISPAPDQADWERWVLALDGARYPLKGHDVGSTTTSRTFQFSGVALSWSADDTVAVRLIQLEPNEWEILRQADSSTSRSFNDYQHAGGKFYVYRITAHNSEGLSYQDWGDDWLFDSPLHMVPAETRCVGNSNTPSQVNPGIQVNPGTQGGQGSQSSQETPAPTVASVAVTSDPGADSTYVIGDTVQVSVTFSEAVTVSGQPQLGLSIGGQSSTANYNGGSGTSTVVFSYDVREGDHGGVVIGSNAIDLNGGSINALSGGKAASLSDTVHTANHIVDAVRPALQSAAVDGATLALTYGKTLDGNSAPTASAFTLNAGGTTRGVDGVSVSGRAVTLTLASAVTADDTVQVGYTAPSSGAIRDLVGTPRRPSAARP